MAAPGSREAVQGFGMAALDPRGARGAPLSGGVKAAEKPIRSSALQATRP
jgi:hypothetical protein